MQLISVDNRNLSCILLHLIIRLKLQNKEWKLYVAKHGNCSVQYSLK